MSPRPFVPSVDPTKPLLVSLAIYSIVQRRIETKEMLKSDLKKKERAAREPRRRKEGKVPRKRRRKKKVKNKNIDATKKPMGKTALFPPQYNQECFLFILRQKYR